MRKKLLSIFLALILSFSMVGRVSAAEDLGFIPDPESKVFGLQMAWLNVSESFQKLITFSEDKEAEIEVKFAEREQRLLEKIAELEEVNPIAAENLQNVVDRLEEKQEDRLDRLGEKIKRYQAKEGEFEEKKNQWVERMQEKRQELLQKREEMRERLNNPETGEQERTEEQSGQGTEDGGQGQGGATEQINQVKPAASPVMMKGSGVQVEGGAQGAGGN